MAVETIFGLERSFYCGPEMHPSCSIGPCNNRQNPHYQRGYQRRPFRAPRPPHLQQDYLSSLKVCNHHYGSINSQLREKILKDYKGLRTQEWLSFSTPFDVAAFIYAKNKLVPPLHDFLKQHDYCQKGNSRKPKTDGNPSSDLVRPTKVLNKPPPKPAEGNQLSVTVKPSEVLQGPGYDSRTTSSNTFERQSTNTDIIGRSAVLESSCANQNSGRNSTRKSGTDVSSMKDIAHRSSLPISINPSQPVSLIPSNNTNKSFIKCSSTHESRLELSPPVESTPVTHISSKSVISKKASHVMDSQPTKENNLLLTISKSLNEVSKVTPAQNSELSKLLLLEVYKQNNNTSHVPQPQNIQKQNEVQLEPQSVKPSSDIIDTDHSIQKLNAKPIKSPQSVTNKKLNELSDNSIENSISATSTYQDDSIIQNPLLATPISTTEILPEIKIVDISQILNNNITPHGNSVPNNQTSNIPVIDLTEFNKMSETSRTLVTTSVLPSNKIITPSDIASIPLPKEPYRTRSCSHTVTPFTKYVPNNQTSNIPVIDLTECNKMSEASRTPVTKSSVGTTSVLPSNKIITPSDIASIPLPKESNGTSCSLPSLITDVPKKNSLPETSVKNVNARMFEENGNSCNEKTNKEVILKKHKKITNHAKSSSTINHKQNPRNVPISQAIDNAGKVLSHKKTNFKADKENKSLPLIVSDNFNHENKSDSESNALFKATSDINGMVGKKSTDDTLSYRQKASDHTRIKIKKAKGIIGSNEKNCSKVKSNTYLETDQIKNKIRKRVLKERFKYYEEKYGIKKCYVSVKPLNSDVVDFYLTLYNNSRYAQHNEMNEKVNLPLESSDKHSKDAILPKNDIFAEMDSLQLLFKESSKTNSLLENNITQTSDKHKQNGVSIQSDKKNIHKSSNNNCDTRFKDALIFNKYKKRKMNKIFKVSYKKRDNHEIAKPSALPSPWKKKYVLKSGTKKSDDVNPINRSIDIVENNCNIPYAKSISSYKYGSIVPLGRKNSCESTVDPISKNMSNNDDKPSSKYSPSSIHKSKAKNNQENEANEKRNEILKSDSKRTETNCIRDSLESGPNLKSSSSNPDTNDPEGNSNSKNGTDKLVQKDRISDKSSQDGTKLGDLPVKSPKPPVLVSHKEPVEEREINIHITEFDAASGNGSISLIHCMTDEETEKIRKLIVDESFNDDNGCNNKLLIADMEDQTSLKRGCNNIMKVLTVTKVNGSETSFGNTSNTSSDTLDVRKKRPSPPDWFSNRRKQPRLELYLKRMEINLKTVNFIQFSCQICSKTFDCNKDWVQHSSAPCSRTPL